MGRSKNSKLTVEEILVISTKLFLEKGYEKTSIQDILDALNLSKGGLYHHFRSKEEILSAVLEKRSNGLSIMFHDLIQNTIAENTKEKLKKIMFQFMNHEQTHSIDMVVASQIHNPYFIVSGLQSSINQDAQMISKLIEEGMNDGSLDVKEPLLCAELFLLLFNIWTNPILFKRNYEQTKERLVFLKQSMNLLGLDILDDTIIEITLQSYNNVGSFDITK